MSALGPSGPLVCCKVLFYHSCQLNRRLYKRYQTKTSLFEDLHA